MQKRTTGIVIAVIIVILAAGGAYAAFHKSPKPKTNSQTSGTSASTTYGSNSPSTQQNKSSTSIIQTKTSSSTGQYLADSNGAALYTYGGDTAGKSNCTGSCLYSWPIYAASSTTSLPANVTVITRSDGSKQYAYKGMPLYTFTGDSAGQVTGDNVSNFHVAKP